VDHTRDALLAGAALSGDENGRASAGNATYETEDRAHRFTATDELVVVRFADLRAKPGVFLDQGSFSRALATRAASSAGWKGFRDESYAPLRMAVMAFSTEECAVMESPPWRPRAPWRPPARRGRSRRAWKDP